MHRLAIVTLLLAGGAVRAEAPPAAAGPPGDEVIGRYLADLEASGRIPAESVSLETLKSRLREAEDRLIRGDSHAATRLLYALVESPRYAAWKDSPAFQNAEFSLGRALLRGHAYLSAERYLLRALARGGEAPYYVPAHRALIDLALQTREYARVLAAVEAIKTTAVPADAESERSYLRGRIAYDHKDLDEAVVRFAAVDRSSRLYPSAAYLRGLVAAGRRQWAVARSAFCEIAGTAKQESVPLRFNVDDRYFLVRDLAHLGLGRIAHEQDHFDEAYYFYFSVPEDSDRLAEALFEASWSMYEKGETTAARAFIEQFDRLFPRSPLRPDAALLRAQLALKSCAFDRARVEVAALLQTYEPLAQRVALALGDADRRRQLRDRLLAPASALGPGSDPDGELLGLLKLDAGFEPVAVMIQELDADLAEATGAVVAWRALGQAVKSRTAVQPVASPEAAGLLDEVRALAAEDLPDASSRHRVKTLLAEVTALAYPPEGAGPYVAEAQDARRMVVALTDLRGRLAATADILALRALQELDGRLRGLLRQGRLVTIDAVVGRKKKLEIEIDRLYAGRLPPELIRKMQAEGSLGDDEEYWPFEGEQWADEYENFK